MGFAKCAYALFRVSDTELSTSFGTLAHSVIVISRLSLIFLVISLLFLSKGAYSYEMLPISVEECLILIKAIALSHNLSMGNLQRIYI